MDEDWDTPASAGNNFSEGGVHHADDGHSFSKGRGFSSKQNNSGNDGWGASNEDSGFHNKDQYDGERTERRGRGGRGGGNRGNYRGGNNRNNGESSAWGDSNENNGDSWKAGGDNNFSGHRGGNNRNNDDGEGWGNGDSNDWENGDSDRRGRGGRGRGGRGRGGNRGGREDQYENADDGEVKKREIYIPPETPTDENEIFHSGNTCGINFTKYDDIEVKTTGDNVPEPIASFEKAELRKILYDNILKSDYTKPTPIQKHSIPIVLNGRDLMACAQTGSGKTAAFLIPIINELLEKPTELVVDGEHAEPQVVIVSPTRELAIQISDEANKFAYHSVLKIVVAYGGTSVSYQLSKIMRGCHILVATPGRMNDFVKRGNLSFNSTRFVVLDEADRMLDMGFLSCVEEMMDHASMVPTGVRQTLMFSATFPEEIQRLAGKFLHDYIFVAVGIVGGACTDVEQSFHQIDKFKKRGKLLEILQQEGTERTLIFVETKRSADFLATFLSENDLPTTSIHGDRLQREREEALRDFKRGSRHILVATGVAARGLDIKNVKHVINFDLPKSIDEYVHRIGRTGRVGNRGKATSFFDDTHDGPIASSLSRILKQADQPIPAWLNQSGSGFVGRNSGFGGTDFRDGNFGNAQDYTTNPVEEPEEAW